MIMAVLAFIANVAFGQNAPAKEEVALIKWETTTTHDFGKIKQGVPVTYEFKFASAGKVPVILTDVRTSCGCTTPSWTREPVEAGGTGHVKATFNAQAPGPFDKTITVVANVEGGVAVLHIKGEVEGNTASVVRPN